MPLPTLARPVWTSPNSVSPRENSREVARIHEEKERLREELSTVKEDAADASEARDDPYSEIHGLEQTVDSGEPDAQSENDE